MKFILQTLFFLMGIILVACTSDEKQPVSRTIVTEMQPLTLLPNADVQPGDTLTFYATLLENEFTKNNGKQKPELFVTIAWYQHDRDPGQQIYKRLFQRTKDENKFYGSFVIPRNVRKLSLFSSNMNFDNIALYNEIYPIRDSVAAYMKAISDMEITIGTEHFLPAFENIRKKHPYNLESFALYWKIFKSDKVTMEKDIDSLERIFPGHPHLTELRLIPNLVYFDSTKAMQEKITSILQTLLQRDSLSLFFSSFYSEFALVLGKEFIIGKKPPTAPFSSYLIDFVKRVRTPLSLPWFTSKYTPQIPKVMSPEVFYALYNIIPNAKSDPFILMLKAKYVLSYIRQKKLPTDSLVICERELKKAINIIFSPDFVDSGLCHEPFHLWWIRYWPYQNLTYALKMQGKLNEAKDSMLATQKHYPALHSRQGEILYELGDIALEQGDTSAFFQYMVRANRINPTFPFPLQELKAQAEKRGVTDFEEFYRSLSDAIPFETMPLPEGTPATLAGTDATTIQLTGKRKKPLLLFFTTSTCSPCKILYKAMLEEMKNNPNKYDVDICLVFPNNDKGFAGYVQANGGKAKNVYFAESSTLHGVFGVSGVPDVAVINRDGVITGFVRGAGPNDNVVSLLSAAK